MQSSLYYRFRYENLPRIWSDKSPPFYLFLLLLFLYITTSVYFLFHSPSPSLGTSFLLFSSHLLFSVPHSLRFFSNFLSPPSNISLYPSLPLSLPLSLSSLLLLFSTIVRTLPLSTSSSPSLPFPSLSFRPFTSIPLLFYPLSTSLRTFLIPSSHISLYFSPVFPTFSLPLSFFSFLYSPFCLLSFIFSSPSLFSFLSPPSLSLFPFFLFPVTFLYLTSSLSYTHPLSLAPYLKISLSHPFPLTLMLLLSPLPFFHRLTLFLSHPTFLNIQLVLSLLVIEWRTLMSDSNKSLPTAAWNRLCDKDQRVFHLKLSVHV